MKSLKGKVILLIIVISAIPLILMSLFNTFTLYNKTVEDVNSLLQTRNENTKEFSDNYIETLENLIAQTLNEYEIKFIQIEVHPFVAAYIVKGFNSIQRKWRKKFKCRFKVTGLSSLSFLENHFYTKEGEEIFIGS